MIRRDFFRKGLATVAGAGFAVSRLPVSALAAPTESPFGYRSFSLDVVTDQPADVMNDIGGFLGDNRLSPGNVKVRMAKLAGKHITDAVFVRNAHLIDFRSSNGRVEDFLVRLSNRYGFRRQVASPTLIRFSAGDGMVSTGAVSAHVFTGDLLIGQRPLGVGSTGESIEDPFEETVTSERGSMVVRYDSEGVRVLDATCKHKTCVNAGIVSKAGESLVCIPSRMRIVLVGEGSAEGDVHVVSQ